MNNILEFSTPAAWDLKYAKIANLPNVLNFLEIF